MPKRSADRICHNQSHNGSPLYCVDTSICRWKRSDSPASLSSKSSLSGSTPAIAVHLLSNYYNQTRAEYYRQLDLARKNYGFTILTRVRGLRDALDEQIQHIRRYQWDVAWRDYVYQKFRHRKGAAAERRRRGCPGVGQGRPSSEYCLHSLRRLTPEIAELYANKTTKTLNSASSGH